MSISILGDVPDTLCFQNAFLKQEPMYEIEKHEEIIFLIKLIKCSLLPRAQQHRYRQWNQKLSITTIHPLM